MEAVEAIGSEGAARGADAYVAQAPIRSVAVSSEATAALQLLSTIPLVEPVSEGRGLSLDARVL